MGRLLEANREAEPGFEPPRRPIHHDHAGWRELSLYAGAVWRVGTLPGGGLLSGRSK